VRGGRRRGAGTALRPGLRRLVPADGGRSTGGRAPAAAPEGAVGRRPSARAVATGGPGPFRAPRLHWRLATRAVRLHGRARPDRRPPRRPGRAGAARAGRSERFTHVLVDEFQDTDPLQAEILLLIASADPAGSEWRRARPAPGKFFVVGDPKQSIYRFRRADIALYEDVKRLLLGAGAELLHLTTSFRSSPSIQEAVNAAFAPVMQGGTQASYVALHPFRSEVQGQPAVVALPAPRIY